MATKLSRDAILDPREASEAVCNGRLQSWQNAPNAARRFGYAPSHDDLQVGDLILVRPVKPDFTAAAISWSQRQLFYTDPSHTAWTHAAVYVGDGEIIEADKKGVVRGHLGKYLPSHLLLFRRSPDLNEKQRHRIALRAYWHVGRAYARAIIQDLLFAALRARFLRSPKNRKFEVPANRVICSILYNKCYFYACDRSCIADKSTDYYISPAHLSATPILEDVSVGWSKLQ